MTAQDSRQGAADRPRIRRAQRTDFTMVMQLVAHSGEPVPAPDRAMLRRFRNLVSDLGCDLYLAMVGDELVGLVHVTYARQLTTPARGEIAQLLVGPGHRRRGIGRALVDFALARARKRGCIALECAIPPGSEAAAALFGAAGFTAAGSRLANHLFPSD